LETVTDPEDLKPLTHTVGHSEEMSEMVKARMDELIDELNAKGNE